MELNDWVKVFDRLLPRSRIWHLVLDRVLKKFFHGLSILPKMIREHIGSILLEAFPATTTRFEDWSYAFGSPETLNAIEIASEWAAFGGQSPAYIQQLLQDAGFNVYVHEWWYPGTEPPVARDPIALVDTSRVLVNDITWIDKNYTHQFGDGSQFKSDGSVFFGNYDGWYWHPKVYPTPDDPLEYPSYFYVCDEVWPQYALIPASKLRTLIRLIYKVKPVHLRCILRVTTYDDTPGEDDIQDTYTSDEWIQDMISSPDDLEDKH